MLFNRGCFERGIMKSFKGKVKRNMGDAKGFEELLCDECRVSVSEGFASLSKKELLRPKKLIKSGKLLAWLCNTCRVKFERRIRK